jgi:F-box/WD-40 domain protein 7
MVCITLLIVNSSLLPFSVQFDGEYVVSGAYDFLVKIWDPFGGTCLHTLHGHTNRVYSLLFDGTHVVSGSLDTSIRVWDVKTGQSIHTLVGNIFTL